MLVKLSDGDVTVIENLIRKEFIRKVCGRMYGNKISISNIAFFVGTSRPTIYRYLKEVGIALLTPKKNSKQIKK